MVCWIWRAALLVLTPSPCLATTIVAVRTPDAVVIAADSEGTFKGGNEAQTGKRVRKIFEEDGVLYAISGLANNLSRGFDSAAIIAASLRGSGNLHLAARDLESALPQLLQHLLLRLQNEEPLLFQDMTRKWPEGDRVVTAVLLASFQNGEPLAIGISFSGTIERDGKIVIHPARLACPGNCPNGDYTFFLGENKAIKKHVAEHGSRFNMSPEDAVKFMVQLEIDAKNNWCGATH